jgi:hypothetical protein
MKLNLILLLALFGFVIGCTHLPETKVTYLEVRLENSADVKISSVAIGKGDQCSDFGLLGSKGAGATAVVPVEFVRDYPVIWEEAFDGKERQAVIDLRQFEGVKNRAITVRYKGNGQWEAELGREIRPSTNAVSNVSTNK